MDLKLHHSSLHNIFGKPGKHSQDEQGSERRLLRFGVAQKYAPQNDAEMAMQKAWAEILPVDKDSINRESHFFRAGGDMIRAMLLCKAAESNGFHLKPRDVFKCPFLKDISAIQNRQISDDPREGWLLFRSSFEIREACSYISRICHVQELEVLDVMRCSPLQEGLLALTTKNPGHYVAKNIFKLCHNVNIDKLRQALNQVVVMNPILRTRLVSLPEHGLIQAVLAEEAHWFHEADANDIMGLGTPLTRFSIMSSKAAEGENLLLWEIHHALYDGWSMNLLLKDVEDVYFDRDTQDLESMERFLQYTSSIDNGAKKEFWQMQFAGTQGIHFPLANAQGDLKPNCRHEVSVSSLDWAHGNVTPSTILRAAWSIIAAHNTGSNESVFGVVVTGRLAPVLGIETMVGPAIATVPVRIILDWDRNVDSLLNSIQRQSADMIPFEQTGLQHIRRVSEDANIACGFQTLLVVHPPYTSDDAAESALLSAVNDESATNEWQDFSTYALVIECQLERDSVHICLTFDSSTISAAKVAHITDNFTTLIHQISDQRTKKRTLRDLVTETQIPFGLDQIWTWNQFVPTATESCIHDLILQRVIEDPAAIAVYAWDGSLTYGELDQLSNRLAQRLVPMGIYKRLVPLYFEKSMWMPVAALAIMKAGAASVALDTKLPEERLRSLTAQLQPIMVLSSVENRNTVGSLVSDSIHIIVVGPNEESLAIMDIQYQLPRVQSSDTVYAVFTSGSTGTAKCVLVSHRNLCSAITYQQKLLQYSRGSRVLNFSSYAFDVSWCNLANALTAGGCLCIPSAIERENELAGCIKKYGVTIGDFTPSVARILGPRILSRLKTLILGGEALVPSDAFLAGDETTIMNAYGPAECTPTVTLSEITTKEITIGRGAGVCTWVVDVNHPDLLAPIGEIGELWIEGPLVGQGYLNDPEKVAASFINDPAWLVRGAPGRQGRTGRVYRTGDLVRYLSSGELQFIGRKDTQVKIRGQRVELNDIEFHLYRSIDSNKDKNIKSVTIVAEMIRPNEATNPILVAFVSLQCHQTELTDDLHRSIVHSLTAVSDEYLRELLPIYMVPSSYIPIRNVPLTPTGKIDRLQLRKVAELAWRDYRRVSDKDSPAETLNNKEQIIQQIWTSVLNLSVEETSVNKAFTRLGGDSISAMQIVAQCRQHNILVTVGDILQSGTIRNLATRCRSISRHTLADEDDGDDQEQTNEPFDLSPIQHLFFYTYPNGLNHFNQSFILELGTFVPGNKFLAALQDVVGRHAILRARFHPPSRGADWMQSIAEDGSSSFAFTEHNVSNRDEVAVASQWRQENLDIKKGPVFACDLFNVTGDTQLVTLSAHHLVIDLVSWRIIWADIEDHIKHGKLISAPSSSWRSWLRRQIKTSCHASPLSVLPFSVPLPSLDFWGLPLGENTFGGCQTFGQSFNPPISNMLVGEANDSLRTEPRDILVGAIVHSFLQTFPERAVPVIWMEGHGREQSDDWPIDISGTVGWFTTIYPQAIAINPGDSVVDAIKRAKDTRRIMPGNGQPYFACRWYSKSGQEAFRDQDFTEITFNFAGRFQQLEAEEGLFKSPEYLGESISDISEISQNAPRPTMIEINAEIEDETVQVSFQFHQKMKHLDRLRDWSQLFGVAVENAVKTLCASTVSFTVTDFPLISVTYRGLEILLNEQLPGMKIGTDSILDIIPCSPLQEGILLSFEKDTASYATSTIWRCVTTDRLAKRSVPSRLQSAWNDVVKRHSILSTVFALHPEGNGFIQIILKNANVEDNLIKSGLDNPISALTRLKRRSFAPQEPQHCFTVCESANGEVACRLDINHALIDAASINIILQELMSLYDGVTLLPAPKFGDMIRHISSIPRAQRIAPWVSMLDGVRPCEFPTTARTNDATGQFHSNISVPTLPFDDVSRVCKALGITRAVFFQVAWAIVLSYFTGMDEVCFGYPASGRDAPLDGIDSMVGPLANLLISRINLNDSPRHTLDIVSKQSIQRLAMQHVSLADIQHELGMSGKNLFNTSLSVLESDKLKTLEKMSVSFEMSAGEDLHEFDIKLDANIDGGSVDLVIEYREPHIDRNLAEEACTVLSAAVAYLLKENSVAEPPGDQGASLGLSSSHGTIFDDFYKSFTGTDIETTTAFWKAQFHGTTGSHFPMPQSEASHDRAYRQLTISQSDECCAAGHIATVIVVRAAWAITVANLLGSTETIFGAAFADAVVLPVRVPINWEQSVADFFELLQNQAKHMEIFRKTGLHRIRLINSEAALACDFQSIISVTSDDQSVDVETFSACPVLIDLKMAQLGYRLLIKYDSKTISEHEATRLFNHFDHMFQQLLNSPDRNVKLRDISMLSEKDLIDVWTWNSNVSESIESNVPHLILQTVLQRPSATAIDAWDGSLTYQQLDDLSTGIAHQLKLGGVQKGDAIPLCFEKSMWMPVSIIAVMKIGAVCVTTDPSTQPLERLRSMVSQVDAKTILASVSYGDLAQKLGATAVITIGPKKCFEIISPSDLNNILPSILPSDLLYIMFTSGSTGVPKGAMITHGNFCSAIAYQRDLLGFTADSRVLDFSSYAFDAIWSNMLHTLTAGGCLCIPSAEQRQESIAGCLETYHATLCDFIPSVLSSIEPKAALSQLSTLMLGGEVVLPRHAKFGKKDGLVVSVYGPAECTPTSIILHLTADSDGGLGRGYGVCTWVVEADDPDKLAPIGAIGELLLEGPLVGTGYINNSEKTQESYIEDPVWLVRGIPGKTPGRRGRLYRTGDLVQYREDGSLTFKGRRDSQVKFRGQRVELEEVEHYVQDAISAAEPDKMVDVVAESIMPQGSQGTMLVAFVSLRTKEGGRNLNQDDHEQVVRKAATKVVERLNVLLPSFMIPSVYISLPDIPTIATGKIDRRQLRSYGSTLTAADIAALSRSFGERRGPITESERLMQSLWAEVLNIEPNNIGIDDSFFRMGGDSIGAMKLVGLARKSGFQLAVRDVFQNPIMRDLCTVLLSS